MKWFQKIEQWKNGEVQTYPDRITKPFFFETFRCDEDMQNTYKEKFIATNELYFNQDYTAFSKHIMKQLKQPSAHDKHVTTFLNLNKDALMVIPMPRKGKEFSTIKSFIDEASWLQQRHFWREVAYSIEEMLKTHEYIYVSTHGLGVPYFHLRLDFTPKYYRTKEFI